MSFSIGSSLGLVGPVSPVEGELLTLGWDKVSGASWYQVRIERDGVVLSSHWVEGENSLALDYTLAPGTFQWTVRPSGEDGFALRSAPADLTVKSAVDAPPVSPPAGATLFGMEVVLLWPIEEGDEWYHLKITRDDNVYVSEWIDGSVTRWASDGVLPGGRYEWAVRSWGAGGLGSESELGSFFVLAAI